MDRRLFKKFTGRKSGWQWSAFIGVLGIHAVFAIARVLKPPCNVVSPCHFSGPTLIFGGGIRLRRFLMILRRTSRRNGRGGVFRLKRAIPIMSWISPLVKQSRFGFI